MYFLARKLVSIMLEKDPNKRPSIKELLENSWIKKHTEIPKKSSVELKNVPAI